MTEIWGLLAQATQPATPPGARPDVFLTQLIPIILMVVVFYWIMMRGGRKDRRRTEDMLKSLKRNDRVQTIGGVYGTVVEVRDNEVVLKVDEASNVKMRFNRGSIKEVIRDSATTGETK